MGETMGTAAVAIAVDQRAGGQRTGRLALLDVLRGVAILGTLGTNIWIFTDPAGEERSLDDATSVSATVGLSEDLPGALVEGAFRFLANGKFLALLTILFGVGLAIQYRSAQARGRSWLRSYLWRPVFLFVEGSLHFLLVFAYDVLMGYAVTAILVAVLLTRSVQVQKISMYVVGSLHVVLMTLLTVAIAAAPAPESPSDPAPVGDPTLFASGSYLDQVAFRIDNMLELRLEPIITFALLLFLFLLGVHLFRAGAFGADERGQALRRRLLWLGLGVGLPVNLASTLVGPELFLLDRYVLAPMVALGYLGLVGWIVDRARATGPVITGLASLGRTALSGYVLQNLLCVVVCYGWGLGLASTLDGARPWWVLALWVVIGVVLVGLAQLWLRRFGQGPLEGAQKWALGRLPGAQDRSMR
ncbi:DUF418 domain-containing protein [Micromonospora polyrhachis]|uniref:DUF418 domain-containing protein n=1 Tax=Micromonospora polyrhachis TaxID=1282883 RepID=A0A7W7SW46_9ACTN|nr:DUF418 domain-containing protein [Micromonospora polyrhachis]MBB4962053.1 uncharacterized protein [Micromonospora polyrhachis]